MKTVLWKMWLSHFLFVAFYKSILTINPEADLYRLLKNISYDALVPPEKLPILIPVQLGIYVLNEVDTRTQSFRLKFATRLLWQDGRISFSSGLFQISRLKQRLIWIPDIIFLNTLGGSNGFDQYLKGDGYGQLKHDGTIEYRELGTQLLSCPMKLHAFPFDTQFCKLELSVVGSNVAHVTFQEIPFTYETKSGKGESITGWELVKANTFWRPWSKEFNQTVLV